MSVVVEVGDRKLEFENFAYDPATKSFRSDLNESSGIAVSVSTPLTLDNSFEEKEFHVCLLSKRGLRENDIFQVVDRLRDRRIGWCIPVNAIDSVDHDYADNSHFQRYAYIGIRDALNSMGIDKFTKGVSIDDDGSIQLSDFLPDTTSLLIVSQETLDEQFNIAAWLPALGGMGYFLLTKIDPSNICMECESPNTPIVKLSPISKEVENLAYLQSIYSHTLPFESKAVFRFFYLYQVIELLMELVFRAEQSTTIDELIVARDDMNTTKELMEKINKNLSEKQRMGLLIRNYSRCEAECGDLVAACNDLLTKLGKPPGTTFETTLYPIRNFLFHQYRNFPSTADGSLEVVIDSLAALIPTILALYKPAAAQPAAQPLESA